jgi:hypothetical protein
MARVRPQLFAGDIAGGARRGLCAAAGALALALTASPVFAQPAASTISYPASYFAAAQLNTAYDMVSRLPGFVFDDGNSARGFAGTAGNVLIDGERPSAKTDDLQSVLKRIPASRVDHIDLIRGGAPGIDMQGHSVIANLVLKAADSTSVIVTANDILYADGADAPGGSVEFSRKSGDWTYDATLTRITGVGDDDAGNGAYVFAMPGGATDTGSVRRRGGMSVGWGFNGSTALPLLGGKFGANLTAQQNIFTETLAYGLPDSAFFLTENKSSPNELGLNWNDNLGASEITLIALGRFENDNNLNNATGISGPQSFREAQHTSETILRGTWQYHWSDTLTLEGGGEGAYNTLNGNSTFLNNGAAVAIPGANSHVNERRGEIFAQATWKFPDGSVEAGSRAEFSRISALGALSRSFSFIKPRLLVSWSPWDGTQLRFRAERVVGQLDFSNFIASSNLSGVGVSAGNVNLRPDQHWQFETDYELHFWGSAALILSAMHDDITDLVDFIPIGGGLDGPGNIKKARNNEFKLNLSAPFDRLGAKGGVLKANLQWDDGAVKDPLTGGTRPISGQNDRNIWIEYQQDVPDWHSTFDVQFNPGGWSRPSYRINQVSTTRLETRYAQVSWEYKPTPDWDVLAELDGAVPYSLGIEQDNYGGPRNLAPLAQVQKIHNTSEPRLWLQLRRTF